MEGDEIIDLFYTIVDDEELSSTVAYTLLNLAEDQLEDERDWMVLRVKDTSLTHSTSDTYATAHTLPSNFKRELLNGMFVQYANGEVKQIFPVKYEEIEMYRNEMGRYAINYATGNLYLTGAYTESVTIIVNYIKRATDLADGVTCPWPGKYGSVLAYMMAQTYSGGMDGDDVNFRMSENQKVEMATIKYAMAQWDGNLQLRQMGYQAGINPRTQ